MAVAHQVVPHRTPRGGELTPAQHAVVRRHLALIPAYVFLIFGWSHVYLNLQPTNAAPADRDFMHFYVQGVVANSHDVHALYDMDAQEAILASVVPGVHDVRFPPVYGPQVSLLFGPLARLPYATALQLWIGISLVLYALSMWALWRVSPQLRDRPWTMVVLVAGAPALVFDVGFGQTAALAVAFLTLGYLALRANRPFLAGLAIGLLAYKPQLGLAAAFVFLFAGEWRIVLGALTMAALQLVAGCAYWGLPILRAYLSALGRIPTVAGDMETFTFNMHSWRAFFELLLPSDVALQVYIVAAIFTAIVAFACWRARGPLALRYGAFLIATVLVNPHLYVYDLLLVVPALLLLWNWILEEPDQPIGVRYPALASSAIAGWSFRRCVEGLLYVCYFAPLFGAMASDIHVQTSVVVHAALLAVIAARLVVRSEAATDRAGTRPLARAHHDPSVPQPI